MVERAQLIWHGRGRVGRATPVNSEMGEHFDVWWVGRRDAREGLARVEAGAAKA